MAAHGADVHALTATGSVSGCADPQRPLAGDRSRLEQARHERDVGGDDAGAAPYDFLASMGHALRTPLCAILGYTGMMLMELPGPITEEQRRQLETVRSSGRQLVSLIDDLLDLARIEAGRLELDVVPVGCLDLLQQVIDALRPASDAQGSVLSVDAPATEVVIRSDRRALKQILTDLGNSALERTGRGSVTLGVMLRDEGSVVEFRVTDTGAGISEAEQGCLRPSFQPPAAATSRDDEAAALGLYTTRKLAEALGGQLRVAGGSGIGNTFTVCLPVR